MRKYRDKLEIVHDILSAISGGNKKTQIMFKAYLNHKILNRYLGDLLMADLVVLKEGSLYFLTEKGEQFLSKCKFYFSLREQVESSIEEINDEEIILKQMLLSVQR